MAQLIDILLVTVSVGLAVWATLQYFSRLGRHSKNTNSGTCSNCDTSCH